MTAVRITVVEICVISEAAAAPEAPHGGIRARFSTILSAAALIYRYFKYFCCCRICQGNPTSILRFLNFVNGTV